jgi:non-ribosomal peptide synthetase component E (peptide arylation enzyme)
MSIISRVAIYEAKTALPYEHLQRATAGLRAELRDQVLAAGDTGLPD